MHKNITTKKNKLLIMTLLILLVLAIPMIVNATNTVLPSEVNGIIILEDDVELEKSFIVENGEDITIDLNGHNLSAKQKVIDVKGGKLTITGIGTIKEIKPNYAPIHITGDSSNETVINVGENVTLEGWAGIMTSQYTNKNAKITINHNGKINALYDVGGGEGIGIYINGNLVDKENININLSSSVTIDSTGNGIYSAGYATWNIDGAVIKGLESGIGLKAGKFNINNATIIGTGEDKTPTAGYGNGINPSGAAIQIESNDGYAGNIEIYIKDGKYESEKGITFYEYLDKDTKETKVTSISIENGEFISAESKPVFAVSDDFAKKITKFITGGTFGLDVSEFIGEDYYAGIQSDGKYIVKKIVNISDCNIVGIEDKIYTGKEIEQDITIKYNGQELINNTDYIVSYKNNKNIGTAIVTITGKGYFKGTVTKTFEINPISIENIKVTGISNKTYTGNALTQSIVVTLNGNVLKKDTDYVINYSNNTKPGKATVTITGKGIYEGIVTKTFIITPKKITGLKVSKQTTSSIKIEWSKHEGVTGYKVYSYNYSKKKWEYVGKTDKNSYTIEKLKAGTTYKYRVRAYKNVDGTQHFGSYTSSLKTATKPKTPSVKVKAGDKKLTLTWKKISGATGYEIYMATSKNGKYTRIKTINNNKTFKYTKSGLKSNKKYYFKVRAYRQVDDKRIFSLYTKVLSATTKKVHVVKKGETLYRIAKNNKTTVSKLVKINNLKKATLIRVGLRLLLN